jgi:hypothetical protein
MQATGVDTLTPAQRETLAAVLDEIVPPRADGRLPGAGSLGLAGAVEASLARAAGAVAALAEALDSLAARGFGALATGERLAALRAFEAEHAGFLPGLVFPTYAAYYRDPRVYAALGLEPRPPHPKGHALEPGDLRSLDAVRARGKIYRDV